MRAFLLAPLLLLAVQPAVAQSTLPDGVEQLLTCGNVYSMTSKDAEEAGDAGAGIEFLERGEALIWQALAVMEGSGFAADRIENAVKTSALTTGLRYAAEAEAMLAECLAAEDSP